ncbi:MAG TPA: hypothetical protein VFG87_26810, partial [Amycolatopsis sp.]|nr:hypothetical protein [Amycolatopsis sp.]
MLKIMARAATVAAGFALLCTVFFAGTSQAAQQPAPRGNNTTAHQGGQVNNAAKTPATTDTTDTAAAQPDET